MYMCDICVYMILNFKAALLMKYTGCLTNSVTKRDHRYF